MLVSSGNSACDVFDLVARAQRKARLQVARHDHARGHLHVHASVVVEDFSHRIVGIGPLQAERVARLLAWLKEPAGLGLSPGAPRFQIRRCLAEWTNTVNCSLPKA